MKLRNGADGGMAFAALTRTRASAGLQSLSASELAATPLGSTRF